MTCVKSVLAEFSSGVSTVYAVTKVLSHIWGPLLPGDPPPGGYGGPFLRLWLPAL